MFHYNSSYHNVKTNCKTFTKRALQSCLLLLFFVCFSLFLSLSNSISVFSVILVMLLLSLLMLHSSHFWCAFLVLQLYNDFYFSLSLTHEAISANSGDIFGKRSTWMYKMIFIETAHKQFKCILSSVRFVFNWYYCIGTVNVVRCDCFSSIYFISFQFQFYNINRRRSIYWMEIVVWIVKKQH